MRKAPHSLFVTITLATRSWLLFGISFWTVKSFIGICSNFLDKKVSMIDLKIVEEMEEKSIQKHHHQITTYFVFVWLKFICFVTPTWWVSASRYLICLKTELYVFYLSNSIKIYFYLFKVLFLTNRSLYLGLFLISLCINSIISL